MIGARKHDVVILMRLFWIGVLFLFLGGCSGLEQSEQEKLRKANLKGEFILRNHDEFSFLIYPPKYRTRSRYPWEHNYVGNFPKITKEFFRCRGKSTHPERIEGGASDEKMHLFDCGGGTRHSLPIREGREFVYPVLIEILNYIQARTCKKVMITCGHRCPQHNLYADSSKGGESSKHMVGAEVDFYVAGLEHDPEGVIDLIFRFYRENARYRGRGEFEVFQRYEEKETDVSTAPWYNREVFVKLYKRGEGRDLDNDHPYPYISIQVIRDRDKNRRVTYSWPEAHKGYHQY